MPLLDAARRRVCNGANATSQENPMLEGLSTNRLCESSAACLASSGKAFVIRYYSRTTRQPEKQLRPREAAELARAGLQLAVVYQDRARDTADFNFERGQLDGASAFASAGQVGQPGGSAIYFAVDTDFSAAQIRQFVEPYFRGVREALDQASGGASIYRVGVYGSGLCCRLLKSAGLAEFTWLAEATGWRESRGYTDFDVQQFVTDQALCDIGNGWQRCTARPGFGQFQPVGFAVRSSDLPTLQVKATQLNLRFVPSAQGNEPIVKLPQGTPVVVLGESAPGWLRVRVNLGGATYIGHVSAAHLQPLVQAPPPPPAPTGVPAVHLSENSPSARRCSTGGRASPIGEAGRPTRDSGTPAAQRVQQLIAIADWLDVERSARYLPADSKTYCNIYATDYCYLAGAYLPRCWWTGDALLRLGDGQSVAPAYDRTIREMRADDLYRWLIDFGPRFGWRRVADATALQAAANAGGVGVICADRREEGRSGHITVVVPETTAHRAQRDAAGNVSQPLQSQAGTRNRRHGSAGTDWWLGSQFVGHVMFVHD
jgi:hypothetical protein